MRSVIFQSWKINFLSNFLNILLIYQGKTAWSLVNNFDSRLELIHIFKNQKHFLKEKKEYKMRISLIRFCGIKLHMTFISFQLCLRKSILTDWVKTNAIFFHFHFRHLELRSCNFDNWQLQLQLYKSDLIKRI